jgi:acyl carrier protein
MNMSDELIPKVKQMIIDALRIEGMSPDEIDDDAPLFGEGLGLDSIDALQLVVAMEKDFGVVVPDAATGSKVFASVRAMAAYIAEHRQ